MATLLTEVFSFNIRPACSSDCSAIHEMIQELADYEKMSTGPQITEKDLLEDGFGVTKYFQCFVAEAEKAIDEDDKSRVIGYALFFFTYSTWEGRTIYMEDIYVKEKYRHHGVGTSLLRSVAEEGIRKCCVRLEFAVLDWNKPSIEFYKSKGAVNLTHSEGWHKFRMNKNEMISLSKSN